MKPKPHFGNKSLQAAIAQAVPYKGAEVNFIRYAIPTPFLTRRV